MNRIKVYLLLLAFYCQLITSFALAGTTLKVGTYNIRVPNSSDTGERDWSLRRESVVKTITTYNYDIIGLNECHGGAVMDYLEGQLSDYTFIKYSDQQSIGTIYENFNPILFLTSKFELINSGVFYLGIDLTRPNISWDNNVRNYRFTAWAKLKVKETGEIIFFFETHLDHEGNDARNEQARINMEQVRLLTGGYPTILAGDHNSSTTRIPFYNIMNSYMQDCRSTATTKIGIENGDGTMSKHTVNGQEIWDPDYHKSSRIDYIWAKGTKVNIYQKINDTFGRAMTPSDHFALQATVTLNDYNPTTVHKLSVDGNINDMINNANIGDTILVEAGKLTIPGIGKTATVKVNKSLTIIGGYNSDFSEVIGRTELSGDINENDIYDNYSISNTSDNVSHIITVNQGCALELKNFELHGGNAPQGGATAQGGAIYSNGNMVHLNNCIIHDNVSYSNGAGVYSAGQITAQRCIFYNNISLYGSGGSIYSPANSSELFWRFTIKDCEFYGNKASMGSACFTGSFSQLHVSGSSFHDNYATNAGTYYASRTQYDSKVCFANNTFANNTLVATTVSGLPSNTKGGSAIMLSLNGEKSTVALVCNTIVGNTASCLSGTSVPDDFYGAAVHITSDATVRLYQNIIAGNKSNATTGGDVYLTNLVHVDTQRNVYSSTDNCHINFSDNDYHMSTFEASINALATMLDGKVENGLFKAYLTNEGNTSVVAVKNLTYGIKNINDVPAENFYETKFYGDANGDADISSVITTDQRGYTRNTNSLAVRGAYEYGAKTGINVVNVDINSKHNNAIYNLNGLRVGVKYQGIIIKNGKKYLMK